MVGERKEREAWMGAKKGGMFWLCVILKYRAPFYRLEDWSRLPSSMQMHHWKQPFIFCFHQLHNSRNFRVVKFCICIPKEELLDSRQKKECRYLVGIVLSPERKHLQWANRHIDSQWPGDYTESFPQSFWIGWSSLPSPQRAYYISGRFGEY